MTQILGQLLQNNLIIFCVRGKKKNNSSSFEVAARSQLDYHLRSNKIWQNLEKKLLLAGFFIISWSWIRWSIQGISNTATLHSLFLTLCVPLSLHLGASCSSFVCSVQVCLSLIGVTRVSVSFNMELMNQLGGHRSSNSQGLRETWRDLNFCGGDCSCSWQSALEASKSQRHEEI